MKKLIIAMSMLLSGCAVQYGDAVSADEVGKARIAAEQKQFDGEMKFRAGSGLVYTRANNQCGNNCAKYAQRELEFQREQESKREAVLAKHQAEMKRQDEIEYRAIYYTRCVNLVSGFINSKEIEKHEAVMSHDLNKVKSLDKELKEFKSEANGAVERCIEKMSEK